MSRAYSSDPMLCFAVKVCREHPELADEAKAAIQKQVDNANQWGIGPAYYAAREALQDVSIQKSPESNPFGYCPHCGQPGAERTRMDGLGSDKCHSGHVYPSKAAVSFTQTSPSV